MLATIASCVPVLLLLLHGSQGALQLIKQQLSFFEAEVYCELHGGHLVSIHSQAENNLVHNLCDSAQQDCWIGLTSSENAYQWVDRSAVTYTNWHPGEPDNWNNIEKCAKMLSQYHDGAWSDQSCDALFSKAYFVCNMTGGSAPSTSKQHSTTPTANHTIHRATSSSHVNTHSHVTGSCVANKLCVNGAHFTLNGQRVFLSGINQAWVSYGYDFGAGQYQYRRQAYERTIQQMSQAGGNSIRVWVHIEGATSPSFTHDGHVSGTDSKNTLISDLRQYIRYAAQHNILVFPTLWNGALEQRYHYHLDGLIKDTSKLQSYIDHALIPMVNALKNEPGLGGWDIINEFEGEVIPDLMNADSCFDTRFLHNSGAGWVRKEYTAQQYLRFINYQADAIRRTDPHAQVTAGAWSPNTITDQFGLTNLYKDECLTKAGGKRLGTLTFYSVHSYDSNRVYSSKQPFKHNYADYQLDKPLVIAEFNQKRGGGMTSQQQYTWAYNKGYAGAWAWSYTDESWNTLAAGMNSIKNFHDQHKGGKVKITL